MLALMLLMMMLLALPATLVALLVVAASKGVGGTRVLWAIDGDTLFISRGRLRGERVRLIGIDAPERPSTRGKEAARVMDSWTRSRIVQMEFRGRDRYGRRLAYVSRRGEDLGLTLLKAGLARATPFGHERLKKYVAAARALREERSGRRAA